VGTSATTMTQVRVKPAQSRHPGEERSAFTIGDADVAAYQPPASLQEYLKALNSRNEYFTGLGRDIDEAAAHISHAIKDLVSPESLQQADVRIQHLRAATDERGAVRVRVRQCCARWRALSDPHCCCRTLQALQVCRHTPRTIPMYCKARTPLAVAMPSWCQQRRSSLPKMPLRGWVPRGTGAACCTAVIAQPQQQQQPQQRQRRQQQRHQRPPRQKHTMHWTRSWLGKERQH
jgi:hypothetical protein